MKLLQDRSGLAAVLAGAFLRVDVLELVFHDVEAPNKGDSHLRLTGFPLFALTLEGLVELQIS